MAAKTYIFKLDGNSEHNKSEIPDSPSVDRTGTLSVVASRLFTGFRVRVASGPDGLGVAFERGETPRWAVRVSLPELREPVLTWFRSDLLGLEDEVASLLTELPAEALHWVDVALRERIGELLERRLPNWDFSVQVALEGEDDRRRRRGRFAGRN